jgi:hypothetical protein
MSPIHSLPPNPSADQVKNALNKAFNVLTAIVIDTGNTILDPDELTSLRNGPIAWIVYNNDSVPHTVTIDPGSFKIKGTNNYVNPIVGNKSLTAGVDPGEYGVLIGVIRGNAQVATYKYSILSDAKTLDPDLDVVDP